MTTSSNSQSSVNGRFDVVVAGAGPAGLAEAIALSRGLGGRARVALLSREAAEAPSSNPDSRAVALSAASVRMLERIGVWARCSHDAQPVLSIDITDSSLEAGVRPVLLTYANVLDAAEPASHIVPSLALQSALWQTANGEPALTIMKGCSVAAFSVAADEVTARLDSGAIIQARLLIAADGKDSALRAMAQIKTVDWSYPQTGITVTVRHEKPHGGRAVQHFLPAGPFAMLPLPGNRTCITWSERNETARQLLALDDAAFTAELEARAGGRLGALALDGPRQSWPLAFSLARTFIAPRFALLGDSAHAVHPIAGQGLNLGLRDGAALAEVIVDAARLGLDIGASTTLERYERWRRFDTWLSAVGFDGLNRLFSTGGAGLRSLREFGLGVVNRLPGLKQRLVAEAAGTSGELPRLLRGEAI